MNESLETGEEKLGTFSLEAVISGRIWKGTHNFEKLDVKEEEQFQDKQHKARNKKSGSDHR